jgi:hypothetical protein
MYMTLWIELLGRVHDILFLCPIAAVSSSDLCSQYIRVNIHTYCICRQDVCQFACITGRILCLGFLLKFYL